MSKTTKEFLNVLPGIAMALCVLFALLFSGCTRTVYVPTERTAIRTDTVYSAKLRVDSVIFRDSISVVQKGDTVTITKYRDRIKVRERTDTVYQAVTDSVKVSVPYPVERKLSRWEQTKQDIGGMAIGALVAAALAAVLVWIVKRKRRR